MAQYASGSEVGTQRPRREGPRAKAIDRWLLMRIARALRKSPAHLALWDGTEVRTGEDPPIARIVFRDRAALFGVARHPDLEFGEAYCTGRLDVEGDLTKLLEDVYGAAEPEPRRTPVAAGRGANDVGRSRANVHHHYDLGNDFYRLWLDDEMVYTCAWFPEPDAGLEQAQQAKMDLVCRKLHLKPGETVVEAGCGWGALALHMARRHGVTVKAYNLSHEQIRYARERAAAQGLDGRVEFVEDDYRNIRGRFDVFVSVGMLEHVGLDNYGALGETIDRTVDARRGRGLLHFIGRNRPEPLNPWIAKRIFPGAYPPTLAEAVDGVLAPFDFSVLDVENLRLHYAKTLEHWAARFASAFDRVVASHGDELARAWRLYLAGSIAAFRTGSLQLFQLVFARGRDNEIPWTRAV